jgi:hypothetical protein
VATRCLAALHQARIRGAGRHAGETVERGNVIAPHAAEDCSHARDGVSQVAGLGLVVLGGFEASAVAILEPFSIRGEAREVDPPGLVPRRIAQAFSNPRAVGLSGNLRAERGQVIRAVGMLDRRHEFCAFSPQVWTAPEQLTGGTPLGWIDIGLRAQAAAEQGGTLWRLAWVVFGLAPVDGLHVEGLSQHDGNALCRTQIGEPRPGAEAFNGHDQPLTIRGNGLEDRFRSGFHVAVQHDFTVVTHDADRHRAGMQVDTAGQVVRLGIASPAVSSSCVRARFAQRPHTTGVCGGGGLHQYQSVAPDVQTASLRSRFRQQLRPGVDMTSDVKSWLKIVALPELP